METRNRAREEEKKKKSGPVCRTNWSLLWWTKITLNFSEHILSFSSCWRKEHLVAFFFFVWKRKEQKKERKKTSSSIYVKLLTLWHSSPSSWFFFFCFLTALTQHYRYCFFSFMFGIRCLHLPLVIKCVAGHSRRWGVKGIFSERLRRRIFSLDAKRDLAAAADRKPITRHSSRPYGCRAAIWRIWLRNMLLLQQVLFNGAPIWWWQGFRGAIWTAVDILGLVYVVYKMNVTNSLLFFSSGQTNIFIVFSKWWSSRIGGRREKSSSEKKYMNRDFFPTSDNHWFLLGWKKVVLCRPFSAK